MKVSLNKANKLRNALEALQIEIPNSFSVRSNGNLNGLEEAIKAFKDSTLKIMKREECIQVLRDLIQETNHRNGVNKVISNVATVERILAALGKIKAATVNSRAKTPEEFRSDQEFAAELVKNGRIDSYSAPRMVEVSSIPPDFAEFMKKEIDDAKLSLEEVKEKRNELNSKLIVELPEDVVKFLRENALLKA